MESKFMFVDFEASSLSENSWPIEVGFAHLDGAQVVKQSRLIRPRSFWPLEDWNYATQSVHGIRRRALWSAQEADVVADWFWKQIDGFNLVSEKHIMDIWLLEQLLGSLSPPIISFKETARWAFGSKGTIRPGQLKKVQCELSSRPPDNRAGDDAARLCLAWRAGLGLEV